MDKTEQSDLQEALRSCRGAFFSAAFFSMFINFLMLVPVIYMLQLYDRVVPTGSESTLYTLTLIMLVLFITLGLLEWIRTQVLVRVSTRLETMLHNRLFEVAYRQSLYTGGVVASSQPLDDLTALRQFLTGNGLFAFFDAPWLPFYIAVMFLFHPWYGWMAIFTAIILVTMAIINERLTSVPLGDANTLAASGRSLVNKNLRNSEVIEAMGMLSNVRKRWLDMAYEVLALQSKASAQGGLITSLSKVTRMTAQSVILGLGAYLVIQGEISPGMMIAGSILLGRALAPIDLMIGSWKGFIAARGQYSRLNELLINIPAYQETMPLPTPMGKLEIENVSIVPPGAPNPVIKNLSFEIDVGDSVAIIGPTGAGKSTLARGLLGIWPANEGVIRLDGADIMTWNREALGPHIGYLPQDIELFQGRISENIARFSDIDSEMVIKAAQMAGVHEMILLLSEGYDTVIGPSGCTLSGGQRQRIGLARALYGNPKLVVLDEPNSNLDDVGEQSLAETLAALEAEKITTIIITHRNNVLSKIKKILIIKDGALAAYGLRDDVIAHLKDLAQKKQIQHESAVK